MDRDAWGRHRRTEVAVTGLDAALAMFGADGDVPDRLEA